ncbi:D-2-hydroxyglutarate dehydrogenase YdiJ [Chimaeribacter arupi]|uniref:D-2-hydroxyglutarate dehydrogenase YdiJ n=1 Tax=Chimaeribacter arupi TaxID=2060066 RepID=UPI000C7BC4C8|nr:FAD-binding and (Fe-S)-binding domain-containing protein [Chimaeribacter arupi]PLR30697.1 hypothetical protein CYR23_17415 [Chimaeribacter arupi]
MHIATLHPNDDPVPALYAAFITHLKQAGFSGEIDEHYASRLLFATDNSIYQRMPGVVMFPRHVQDVTLIAAAMAAPQFRGVVLTPRGGGTGTNGQSLTHGIVVDLSRHMNQILEVDPAGRWVRVQAGVVKDQLNAALRPYGLFFAPELSTSNRATLGGMISTDASGQGSCTYGKTRDHVRGLTTVLVGGELLHSQPLSQAAWRQREAEPGRTGEVYRTVRRVVEQHAALIVETFPPLNRCLTGYDLAHVTTADGGLDLNSVLCGAEGTLGFVVEATLNVLPVPRHTTLVNVRYASFMDALYDARALLAMKPLSVETVDSRVLMLAMQDIVWHSVAEYFPDQAQPTQGINLVEFSGDDSAEVQARVEAFIAYLTADSTTPRLGHTCAVGHDAVGRVYAMRKRAVGLLGNVNGEARPQAFVEDTAVPPEHLAAYIAEFRALLDHHQLEYGMFGHVDAGVLHVRPALDMKDERHAQLIRPITDAVAALTRRYGGLLWGEHGKGMRSEYVPAFFGELYPALQAIKAAFDPYNQINPGKIATASGSALDLLKIDQVPTRGSLDRQIDERVWQSYGTAMHCNGNGACYNADPDDAMCPSWKATRDRRHSPKGRAAMMREWLRLQGNAGIDVLTAEAHAPSFFSGTLRRWRNRRDKGNHGDFSHAVYEVMAGCLACKSCAGQCPVKVSVPEFRSRFLNLYHQRYPRPLRDYLIGSLEFTMPWAAKVPGLYNALMNTAWVKRMLEQRVGMVDSPLLSRLPLAGVLTRWDARPATPAVLAALSPEEKARSVVLVQDTFTRYFDTAQPAAFIELAARLGYQVWLAPLLPNGKPLHVQGFMRTFHHAARRNARHLTALAQAQIPLIGLDPAMTLTYRQEYRKVPGLEAMPAVMLPQEWLMEAMPALTGQTSAKTYRLLPHCTEKTNAPDSSKQWQAVFARRGLQLQVPPTGCCGMSGTYGHEARNAGTSATIYALSWSAQIDSHAESEPLATGYSCRSQVKRLSAVALRHPLEILLEQVRTHCLW